MKRTCPVCKARFVPTVRPCGSLSSAQTCGPRCNRAAMRSKHPVTKLDAEKVREIRRMRGDERRPLAEVAERFGVAASTVSLIANYQAWRDVP